MQATALEDMLAGYVECALWTGSIGEDFAAQWAKEHPGEDFAPDTSLEGFGFTAEDIAPEALESMRADCAAFLEANAADLDGYGASAAGHDFWLTRNRHGAGFWDRGLGALGERLSESARAYGESDLYIGDDGRLYV